MTEGIPGRPRPPDEVMTVDAWGKFAPAPDVVEWIEAEILSDQGRLHNPDHAHLRDADIGVLWTTAPCVRKGREVLGMAEMLEFRCNQWQRARQELQIREWFGLLPDFLITLDAIYCSEADDVAFLALLEHELYHCAQATDEFGTPKFKRDTGLPTFTIAAHDVEEFIGVVRRYGMTSPEVEDLVIAAAGQPEVSRLNIARACGTCALRSA